MDSGRHREERGRFVLRSIPLWSERYGLSGRADAVELKGGGVVPVEYKSGVRHGRAADLQVCAQALCLEEMLGLQVPVGYVWYGGPRRRERVELTVALRDEVLDIVEGIRTALRSGKLPDAPNDSRCSECQLRHHCVPELTSSPARVKRYLNGIVFACDT